jgi:polyhydroxybutyrate depolymerase
MKKIIIILLIVGMVVLVGNRVREHRSEVKPQSEQGSVATGQTVRTLTSGDREREYLLYVPASYDADTAVPLVLFYHGGGGGMYQAAEDYNWQAKADKEGFIVAFMNGTSRLNAKLLNTWNAGNCCQYARDNNVDDVQYTLDVIADIKTLVTIDEKQILATGFSNGGMMAHRLACEIPGTFAAIAAVSGTDNTVTCEAATPISVLHIHAKDDPASLFDGGSGPTFEGSEENVTNFTSVPVTIDRWLERNNIATAPARVVEVPGAYCDLYEENGIQVKVCVTEAGGHTWAGNDTPARKSGAVASQALDATDLAWDFLLNQVH